MGERHPMTLLIMAMVDYYYNSCRLVTVTTPHLLHNSNLLHTYFTLQYYYFCITSIHYISFIYDFRIKLNYQIPDFSTQVLEFHRHYLPLGADMARLRLAMARLRLLD